MSDPSLTALAMTLASAELTGWRGLPSRLEPGPLDEAPALVTLGSEFVLAELVHLDDPVEGAWARVWLRDGYVALLDVTWQRPVDAAQLDELGEPEERADVIDGLATLPDGEWLYPGRGLAAVVETSTRRIRRLMGFVPTAVETYRRELQPDFATHRRPADDGGVP